MRGVAAGCLVTRRVIAGVARREPYLKAQRANLRRGPRSRFVGGAVTDPYPPSQPVESR